jgi:2-polyprenyl-3-methyl-5-hydroxy-6-metoxy-1,4-benzoquinol methylase
VNDSSSAAKQIAANVRAHNKVAKRYEKRHGEIYNPIEQERLKSALRFAISAIESDCEVATVLDFGCGAGNLTKHISDMGCNVLAADVSAACLSLVTSRKYPTEVAQVLLNGADLSGVASGSVDMVATYSVLHHVPDYLGIIAEFIRVLKPGGIVFIDHELTEEYWNPGQQRLAFLSDIAPSAGWGWRKYFKAENYVNWFMCKFINPRYRPEGDIHVFADDHVEWSKVALTLTQLGANVIQERKYLLFREGYDPEIYLRYADKTFDMQFLVARKPR